MKKVLVHNTVKEYKEFAEILKKKLEDLIIVTSDDLNEYDTVDFLIIWYTIPDDIHLYSNLKLILNCGSGVDQYLNKLDLFNHNIPIVRLVDPYLKDRVSNYVIKEIESYQIQNYNSKIFEINKNQNIKVVIMGIGILGNHTALKLLNKGYEVVGWSKNLKPNLIYKTITGKNDLLNEIKNCNYLICQLPLTAETENILNYTLFENMNTEGVLINVGRGEHVVEKDLINALDSNKIAGATLDVNRIEPVPEDHIFKTVKNIKLTPHIAGYVGANTQGEYAAKIIRDYLIGKELVGLFDFNKKY